MQRALTRRAALTGLLSVGSARAQMMHSGIIPVIPVTLTTALGRIGMVLYIGKAPLSCKDFLKYVSEGWYDGGAFTRVVRPDNDHGHPKIDVVQGGIRTDAKPWAPIKLETTRQTSMTHRDGTVSLPRDGADTGSGSAFFICVGDQPSLDFGGARNRDGLGFAAFGLVNEGMDVVRRIWRLPAEGASDDAYTRGQMLTRPVTIESARRL
jgi:peptidyl-prolyl cis-trans isomerase A (cyclophilin A)